MFAADPGALNHYLAHVSQKMTEEKGSRRTREERHSLNEALPGALSVKPNPFFKAPSPIHGVPRQQARVVAPPSYHTSNGSDLGILNITWGFRKIFEKKVREALAHHKTSGERKWPH